MPAGLDTQHNLFCPQKAGHFKENIDLDQFAFDLHSMLPGPHSCERLFNDPDARKRRETRLKGSDSQNTSPIIKVVFRYVMQRYVYVNCQNVVSREMVYNKE